MMRTADVPGHVRRRLGFEPEGVAEQLTGGSLNRVWRQRCRPRSVVVKHAPPFVASAPEIALHPSRLLFEANALTQFAAGGALSTLFRGGLRPPALLDVDPSTHTALLEDLGEGPHLGETLAEGRAEAALVFEVGRSIGGLHRMTHEDSFLARTFDNQAVQRTRHDLQYRSIAEYLELAGVSAPSDAVRHAANLGEQLQRPGGCLIMGDLWPPSILMRDGNAYLIDWEFCHYGRPLQDVAHALAHFWMQEHRAPSQRAREAAHAAGRAFTDGYLEGLQEAAGLLWTPAERRNAAVHFGCELTMRATGPFARGYLYDGLDPASPPVREALELALDHLCQPDEVLAFERFR